MSRIVQFTFWTWFGGGEGTNSAVCGDVGMANLTIRQTKEGFEGQQGYTRKITLGSGEVTELLRFYASVEKQRMYQVMGRLRELIALRIAHLGGRRIGQEVTCAGEFFDVPEPVEEIPAPVLCAPTTPSLTALADESVWNTVMREVDEGDDGDDAGNDITLMEPPSTQRKRPYASSSGDKHGKRKRHGE